MKPSRDALPTDLAAAHALILAEREALSAAEARAKAAEAQSRLRALEIERLKLLLAKARGEQYGQSSERSRRLIAQLELALADLEETQAQEESANELAAPKSADTGHVRLSRKPARRPLPDHLPRERIVYPAPCACPACGGHMRKLGEDVTETLECEPRRWKVVQHVREKFTCRVCETIAQPPAPSHPIARGRAGPALLAHVLVSKYGLHLPLHRQSRAYAAEGVDLDPSTLADWVGASAATLAPIVERLRAHVFAAERIHADDTPVPVLAKGETRTGRLWTYVRDDRPFAGPEPPAAVYVYSPDRTGSHPERHLSGYAGLMQADAYAGFARLYDKARQPAAIVEAACYAHFRRKLFEIAELKKAPIPIEAVRRIDELFAIERDINGACADTRRAIRQERSKPLLANLHAWLKAQRAKLSAKSETAKAIDYALKRWDAFARHLDDGRICMTNNAAERALRGIALGRANWTFAGSDKGGERAAALYALIETCRLNKVDPNAWLAHLLAKLPDHPAKRIDDLLPWNCKP